MNILSNAVKYNKEKMGHLYQLQGTSIRQPGYDDNRIYLPGYRNRNDRGVPEAYFEPFCTGTYRKPHKILSEQVWEMPITKNWLRKWVEPLLLKVRKVLERHL